MKNIKKPLPKREKPAIGKWRKIRNVSVTDFKHYQVHHDRVLTPGGQETDYYSLHKNSSVAILALDKNGYLYLTYQHRYPTDEVSLEIPGGNMDESDNGNALQAAKRELEEECGLRSDTWVDLGQLREANGLAEMRVFVFAARAVYLVDDPCRDPLDQNVLQAVKMNWPEIKAQIAADAITDTFTLGALLLAERKGVFA